jgi:histidine ammonia-lyase
VFSNEVVLSLCKKIKMSFVIDNRNIDLKLLYDVFYSGDKLVLGDVAIGKIKSSYDFLQEQIKSENKAIYGINTGFGSLHRMRIPPEFMSRLQENLVKSHACGTGPQLPAEVVRLMLLLKIITLAKGYSGVQVSTVQRLVDFYNEDIIPVVYENGSLGASGDLAPLAHLSLPLIGEGEVIYKGRKTAAAEVLKSKGWSPLKLEAKEGLALLNGTQFMTALGVVNLWEARKLDLWADLIASVSLEAYDGRIEPFSEIIQNIRPHKGQEKTAERIRRILHDSEIIHSEKKHVQDPYSFRCVPQVHGSVKHVLDSVEETFTVEVNAVTDNPIIDAGNRQILSGGNFHGEPLAIASDMLAIAVSELSNISERRTYRLISGKRGLPPYLTPDPGLNSGLMIPQYMAASLVNRNKQLSMPNSVDSIESSNGQEDHVSMGANSVLKTKKIIENTKYVLGVELLTAIQALHFRKKASSRKISAFTAPYRKEIPFIAHDEILYEKINSIVGIYDQTTLDELIDIIYK